ncbi:N-6 DNA methylase [Mycoplasmatota bacterium]|nr:N-6 DNA methylase [Mycoplasmatota bacterium]
MEYRHCDKENFEDFSCGRVIYHRTGMPNFPVRLSQEIYCRCLNYLDNKNNISLYDPCCGGGYLLTVLGFLNMNSITQIYGSDISFGAVELANSNLSLLSEKGIEKRINQLNNLYDNYKKESHKEAIKSSKRILNLIKKYPNKPTTNIFQLDILSNSFFKNEPFKTDIVITDVPYGNLVTWQGKNVDFINTMLNNIIPILKPNSIVAICSDKKQKITSNKFKRLEKQFIGKRKFEILALSEV